MARLRTTSDFLMPYGIALTEEMFRDTSISVHKQTNKQTGTSKIANYHETHLKFFKLPKRFNTRIFSLAKYRILKDAPKTYTNIKGW